MEARVGLPRGAARGSMRDTRAREDSLSTRFLQSVRARSLTAGPAAGPGSASTVRRPGRHTADEECGLAAERWAGPDPGQGCILSRSPSRIAATSRARRRRARLPAWAVADRRFPGRVVGAHRQPRRVKRSTDARTHARKHARKNASTRGRSNSFTCLETSFVDLDGSRNQKNHDAFTAVLSSSSSQRHPSITCSAM